MNVNPFSNPWQHARLLSDAARNRVMIDTVVRHSPGRRVLEVGCGTGLMSCIAARAGASRVTAIEPTDMLYVARDLVRQNGLQDRVEVIAGMVQDVQPRPVDFAFSELLHSDPFVEGVVEASNCMARWLVKDGRLAPYRLTVYAALARAAGPAWEMRAAEAELGVHGKRFDLDLGPIVDVLRTGGLHTYTTGDERPIGPAVEVFTIDLGDGASIPGPVEKRLEVREAGSVAGVMVWFEAQMDEHTVLGNPPMGGGHWGQIVWAFGQDLQAERGQRLRVRFEGQGAGLVVHLLG